MKALVAIIPAIIPAIIAHHAGLPVDASIAMTVLGVILTGPFLLF